MDNEETAISLQGISKSYSYYDSPNDRVRELFARKSLSKNRQILHDIDLTVGRGEVVGIIGENGAGKSTLLKIISGRLQPTQGTVQTNGTMAAILELGSGFDLNLSGRENIKLGGLLMGLSRKKIGREIDKIIAFSELESVIDLPFGTYSTGMQARLTFATAITVDPDILIVDEALSVGDNRFQLKSFSRMNEFKEAGKTILLVTHSMESINTFCDRALLLHQGRLLADDKPTLVTGLYHNLMFGEVDRAALGEDLKIKKRGLAGAKEDDASEQSSPKFLSRSAVGDTDEVDVQRDIEETSDHTADNSYRYGDGRASIKNISIIDANTREPTRQLQSGQVYEVLLNCIVQVDTPILYCGVLIRTVRGETVFGTDTTIDASVDRTNLSDMKAGDAVQIRMKFTAWFSAGTYFLGAAATIKMGEQSDMWFDAYEFVVVGTDNVHAASFVNLQSSFVIESL